MGDEVEDVERGRTTDRPRVVRRVAVIVTSSGSRSSSLHNKQWQAVRVSR